MQSAETTSSGAITGAAEPIVGVVLVNWNGWRDTVAAYRSLERSNFTGWIAIVIDNASTDDSAAQLAAALPDALLLASSVNLGFAGGCNLGLQEVSRRGLRHAFLLNNDAEVLPDTLDLLLAASHALHDQAVLGSVVTYWPSGVLQFFGSRCHPRHGGPEWLREPVDSALLAQPLIESDFLIGAALLMPMAIVRKVGVFDERFFLNYEETDWCYRARACGHFSYVVSAAGVRHAGSASLGSYEGPMQNYFLNRNRLLFSEKHASMRQRLQVLRRTWQSFRHDLRKSYRAARSQGLRFDLSKTALLMGVRDYLLRRFGDCPAAVRELGKRARARQPAPPAPFDQVPR